MDETRTRDKRTPSDDDPIFVIVSAASGVSTVPLPASKRIVLGRAAECDIVIDDESVSRKHAALSTGDPMFLEELGSRNGTVVAGRKLAKGDRAGIALGSIVELGSATLVLQRAPSALARAGAGAPKSAGAIVVDPTMQRLYALLEVVAPSPLAVLILGETGTGKEVFAEAIHARSTRSSGPFVRMNCAALAESVLESELFGHEKGAFTGAVAAKPGLFEAGDGGTVFLDEVGELPATTQAKLLRVLESGEVTRVGSVKPLRVDLRVVSATNRDLPQQVALGRFRADLYFRLNGFSVTLPPLRKRKADVVPLAKHFLERASARLGGKAPLLGDDAIALLERYPWPGNVRELRNVIDRAAVLARGASRIGAEHVLLEGAAPIAEPNAGPTIAPPPMFDARPTERLKESLESFEKARILEALEKAGGNQSEAAKILGIGRRTLIDKIEAYGIPRPRKK